MRESVNLLNTHFSGESGIAAAELKTGLSQLRAATLGHRLLLSHWLRIARECRTPGKYRDLSGRTVHALFQASLKLERRWAHALCPNVQLHRTLSSRSHRLLVDHLYSRFSHSRKFNISCKYVVHAKDEVSVTELRYFYSRCSLFG